MTTYAPCGECSGEIVVGRFEPITVPVLDDAGWPEVDPETGRVKTIRLRLPRHRVMMPKSVFDPTGLVPVMCGHGLPEHPAGFALANGGQSFVRSKYATVDFLCVVDQGVEPPADLTTPRA